MIWTALSWVPVTGVALLLASAIAFEIGRAVESRTEARERRALRRLLASGRA